jgi:hypothetical protein
MPKYVIFGEKDLFLSFRIMAGKMTNSHRDTLTEECTILRRCGISCLTHSFQTDVIHVKTN